MSHEPSLTVRSRRAVAPDGASVVHLAVAGEVDAEDAAMLKAELVRAIDGWPVVRCDLSGITFFGAAGVNVLIAASRHASGRGRRLEVCGARGLTERVIRIAGPDLISRVSG